MALEVSESTIIAQAFRLLAQAGISSFSDTSQQAADAAEQYGEALGICLEHSDWSFARNFAELPEVTTPALTDPNLPYAYQLPGDCVKLRFVYPDGTKWRVDETHLWADSPAPLLIFYTRNLDSEAGMPKSFRFAVSAKLAWDLAPKDGKSSAATQRLEKTFETALQNAARKDAPLQSAARYDGQDIAVSSDWATGATA